MLPLPADASVSRTEIFGTPTWRVAVPEMESFRSRLLGDIRTSWDKGPFERHAHGYGYQSRGELYSTVLLEQHEYLRVLRERFVATCREILRLRHGHAKNLPFDIYAVQAWILVQTNESWVDGPWHNHHPATLSGCYYFQVPQRGAGTEGLLMFQRPEPPNIFCPNMAAVQPLQGHLIVFPSYLMHRPTPCPSAETWRISINMDAFVHWKKRLEEPLTTLSSENYNAAVLASRG
jgi:hypothetical protein